MFVDAEEVLGLEVLEVVLEEILLAAFDDGAFDDVAFVVSLEFVFDAEDPVALAIVLSSSSSFSSCLVTHFQSS